MPRFVSRMRLQGKLILGFSLVLMLALAASSWLFANRSHETLSDILGEQARQISQTLAMAAAPACGQKDIPHLQRLGRELLKSRNIVLVAFFDASGSPLAVACRDPDMGMEYSGQPLANTQQLMLVQRRNSASLGDFLQITAPVVDNRGSEASVKLLGYLTIGISQNNEQAQINRVGLMGVGVGILIFLLSLPLASAVVHRVLVPVRHLAAAARRIAHGDYDAQVASDRPDEIGQMARAFNEMVERIRQQQEALKVANAGLAEANRGLEERVRQRTVELEASNHRLSAEIAEKEDFLRAVSHDLNAPLRNIGGMAAMLLLKCRDRFEEDIVHRLERIQKNVEVETDLIAELLELSRIKTRRQKMEHVQVNEMVNDLGELFEPDLKQKGISLNIETELPVLHCERGRLRQVFQNLIDNAIKYMGDGPTRQIRIGHRMDDGEVEFYVADSGVGIEREDLAKVFYVFRRGRHPSVASVPGKGVGLASVKSIIETYNGRIWVESAVGKGSTFRFTIHRKFVPALMAAGEKVSGTVVRSTLRAVPATVPDTFSPDLAAVGD